MMHETSQNPYSVSAMNQPAIHADFSERAAFIRRTYSHLCGAVLALIAIETTLFMMVPAATMNGLVRTMTGGFGWLIVLGAFMGVSWLARTWATHGSSQATQYAGLGLYVFAEAIILLPLLYICISVMNEPQLPVMAAAITAMTFVGLTVFVFATGVDLSGWGPYLCLAGMVAMATVVGGILFGFSLGFFFCAAMVALACGYILYDTSNVLHHFRTDQHVAASLALFSSVVLLFWYVLRIMMILASEE